MRASERWCAPRELQVFTLTAPVSHLLSYTDCSLDIVRHQRSSAHYPLSLHNSAHSRPQIDCVAAWCDLLLHTIIHSGHFPVHAGWTCAKVLSWIKHCWGQHTDRLSLLRSSAHCSQIKATQTEAKAHTRDVYTRPSLSVTFLWHRGLQPLLQSLFNGSRHVVLMQVYVSP